VTGAFSGWYYLQSKANNFYAGLFEPLYNAYSKTDPKEDFAQSFMAYFDGGNARIVDKLSVIDQLLETLV